MAKKMTMTLTNTITSHVPPSEQTSARPLRLSFSNPNERAAHIRAFLEWLPQPLHDAPDIHWEQLPSPVMGYLIRRVADSPDALPITLAIGCCMHAIKQQTLYGHCKSLTILFQRLRTQYGMCDLAQLKTREIWDRFIKERTLASGDVSMLVIYETLAATHVPIYLESLDRRQRVTWETYALPPLPTGFIERHGLVKTATTAAEKRRKEQSDVLLPLFPLLIEIAQLRKQATERLFREFCCHRDRAKSGEITLPYHFQFTDRQFSIPQGATSISAVEIIEHEITLSLTLWDRVSWVKEHPERYHRVTRQRAERQVDAYTPERNFYFLQSAAPSEDLLWCGDLIANRLLGRPPRFSPQKQEKVMGLRASRPGLLTPVRSDGRWLLVNIRQDEIAFEPESLYRGVLYATALATLALTNGSRVSELLQVSATRFEMIAVDEIRNQVPTGRKMGILIQNLLPKGYMKESDRQFFLIGDLAGRLLTEIGQLLEATHGGSIPMVQPSENTKKEDLSPEPYLFQWGASDDGRLGLLTPRDVGHLLRFLFHGLTLTTRTGKPIRVAPHLLRHILATHARHVKKVPAEAVANLLHHRVTLADSTRTLSISEATAYYSLMPLEQLLALLFEAQATLTTHRGCSYVQAPTPQTLEEMDTALRHIFEQWSLIGPTALGYCSAGLCIRPDNRALCLNCQYLVPHYSNLPKARTWRKLYVLQTQMHDAQGHSIDAQQSRQMVQYLDDIMNLMLIQIHARQDGGYLPFADTLPPVQDEDGDQL